MGERSYREVQADGLAEVDARRARRDAAVAERRRRDREHSERARRAAAWVASAMPDLVIDDRVCDWAIGAALSVRHNNSRPTVAAVRRERDRQVARVLDRTGMTAAELGLP